MIRLLLILQLISSVIYYWTAPFHLNIFVILFWLLNSASTLYLIFHSQQLHGPLNINLKRARIIFTATLLISELVINFTADSYAADNLHGLISDAEVLFTGMVLGTLWHFELTSGVQKA